MTFDPDWKALNQLNFLLAARFGPPLNEALNAIALSEMPDSPVEPQVWRDRAKASVANVLNMYQAWAALIQFKNGLPLPSNAIRAFPVQSLLDWLTVQMEIIPPIQASQNMPLQGNQACIQEATLLLYSAATSQGTNVHLHFELAENGGWFRIRFIRDRALPETIDALIDSFKDHWRSQDAAFELTMARDFILLSGSQITLKWDARLRLGEFAFFIGKSGTRSDELPGEMLVPNAEHARLITNLNKSLIQSGVAVQEGTSPILLDRAPPAETRRLDFTRPQIDLSRSPKVFLKADSHNLQTKSEPSLQLTPTITKTVSKVPGLVQVTRPSETAMEGKDNTEVKETKLDEKAEKENRGTQLLQDLKKVREEKGTGPLAEEDLDDAPTMIIRARLLPLLDIAEDQNEKSSS
jgi:hypothetical protein